MRKFNSKEMDLFFSICSKMKDQEVTTVKFKFSDLKTLSSYKMTATKHFIKDLEGVYSKMLQLTYREETESTITYFVLFNGFRINKVAQSVEISVNPELEYILNELSNEFTQFELREFTNLISSYSKTMYRLIKQYKSTGFYTVKIDEFRILLDVPENYRMSDIDKKVLKPIQRELPKYFDSFTIKKVKAKKGNRIDRLEFTFKESSKNKNLPKVSLHNWLEEDNQ